MSIESRVTFWTVVLYQTLRFTWRQTRAVIAQKARRYADRYYRIGRHSGHALGVMHARRASDIVWNLRAERSTSPFQRLNPNSDTGTLVLAR
jgi:hypothetical protein